MTRDAGAFYVQGAFDTRPPFGDLAPLASPAVAGSPAATTIGQPLTAQGADIVEMSSRPAAPAAAMPHEDATGDDQQEEKDQK
jgi:hypothetical protein